jgi:hypothetical protein
MVTFLCCFAQGVAIMNVNYMNEYDGYPAPELVARAHLAAIQRARCEREEKEKRQILELEEIIQNQPNDFAD